MKILFLCHRIPYPPNKGDKIRSFHELQYLSKNNNIALACLIDNNDDIQYIDELEKYCTSIDYVMINPKSKKVKSLKALLSNKPLSVPYFYSKQLQQSIDRRIAETEFDVVFAFSSPMAEYIINSAEKIPEKTRKIMDFVDVDSDKWRMYAEHSAFPLSFIYRTEWKRLMEYEKRVGELFDVSVFVSKAEADLFATYAQEVFSVSVPNGVDMSFFASSHNNTDEEKEGHTFIFTGAMDYFPNEDGVMYFCEEIWPDIKHEMPLAKFLIVGSNPSDRLLDYAQQYDDIVVTGYVEDIREYMNRADVFVAPLRIARGVQNKVLEALASGLPVVAMPQAVQGIDFNGNGFLFVENTPKTFAKMAIKSAMEPLSDAAKEKREIFLKEHYDWPANMALLEKVMEGAPLQ